MRAAAIHTTPDQITPLPNALPEAVATDAMLAPLLSLADALAPRVPVGGKAPRVSRKRRMRV